jgi:hypothetical protein
LNLALPAFAPYCNPNIDAANTWLDLYKNSAGGFGTITSQKINLKMDGGAGHSGGPVYYCPEEDNEICGRDEKGFVVAVWSGWNWLATTHVGTRVSRFFDWGIALMDGL